MNASDYYKQKIYVAQVNEEDAVIRPVERWEAHRHGILHRGFTAILVYGNRYLLQHRKHPAFDGVWDFTFSSHQVYVGEVLQSDHDAIVNALVREWNITPEKGTEFEFLGKVYYKAKDPNSAFTEHEVDYVYRIPIAALPVINTDFAYGFETVDADPGSFAEAMGRYTLAPWAEKIVATIGLHLH